MAKVRTCPKWLISGIHEAGYYVYFYEAGTTTPKDTYTSHTEGAPNTNPVILDARGEADIWLSGIYKVVVYTGDKDTDGVLVWTVDDYGEGEDQVITGNYNLVKNGSFETDSVTSGEPDDWTIVDYSTGVHAIDTTDQYHGLNSLKFTSTGDGGGYATSDYFEVQEGKSIFAEWVMRSSVVDVRNVVDIIWYTSAKTSISTTNIYDDSATNPTSWAAKSGGATSPSTARYAQLRIYGCHSSEVTSGSTWFDNVKINDIGLFEGTFSPFYSDGINNATMTTSLGFYQRIGSAVHFQLEVSASSYGSMGATSAARIKGLPIIPSSAIDYPVTIEATNLNITAGYSVVGSVGFGSSIYLMLYDATTGVTSLLTQEMITGGYMRVTGSYRTTV